MATLRRKMHVRILRLLGGALFSLLVLATFGEVASAAPLLWNLQGVTYDDGATAIGTFTPFDSSTGYTDWSIVTSAEGNFAAFTYTPATSTVASCCDDELQLTSNDGTRVFDLEFDDSTVGGQSPQNVDGSETIPGDLRRVSSGEIVLGGPEAVPEPQSLLLLAVGGVILLCRKVRARA